MKDFRNAGSRPLPKRREGPNVSRTECNPSIRHSGVMAGKKAGSRA
jgi:hypothetical protein